MASNTKEVTHEETDLVVPYRGRDLHAAGHRIHPALNAQRLPMMVPDFDAPLGGAAYRALLDYSFMFGPDMLVIGVYLLYASRQVQKHLTLVWLIVALEAVRGILDDLYMISRGYNPAFMAGFIVLHLLIIVPGIALVGQVTVTAEVTVT